MFSSEIVCLVNKERHKDQLRALERQRLIKIAESQKSANEGWVRIFVDCITWLMRWRPKLQRNNPVHHHVLYRRR